MIGVHDERTHPAGEDPKWAESFYFNFYDSASGIGGLSRIGIRPHEGAVDGGWLLFLGGRRVAIQQLAAELTTDRDGDGALAVGPTRLRCDEPMATWRLTSNGQALVVDIADTQAMSAADLEIDLSFTATMAPEPIGETLGRAFGGIGHYDQVGAYRGSVRVGDERCSIDGLGLRDHTWGVRDWQAPEQWTFFSVVFEPDVALCASRIVLADGDLRGGWWAQGDGAAALNKVEVDTTWAADGIVPERVALQLVDERGETLDMTGEILCPVPIPMEGGATRIVESLTRFRLGGRVGYGITEHLCQVDPAGRP